MDKMTQKPDLARFKTIDSWIFDLDNTLYPSECNLFAQIDQRMGMFISEFLGVDRSEARIIQKNYYRDYGTTLNGLMQCHGLKPEDFLEFVHDIDIDVVPHLPELGEALSRLPGRCLVLTNGTKMHAARVMERLGVDSHFHEIHDIVDSQYIPKPAPESYDRFIKALSIVPETSALFEDLDRNLEYPHTIGMTTVFVRPVRGHRDPAVNGWGEVPRDAPHIHYRTDDLTRFLRELVSYLDD